MIAVSLGVCRGCLQYREDCECCRSCGCPDVHDWACEHHEAVTLTRPAPRRSTIRGLGVHRPEDTDVTPRNIFRLDDDAHGFETTTEVRRIA